MSYANVTATLALFVALGGTGYAAFRLPGHSVGSRQLRTGAVRNVNLARGSVGHEKIRRGAVYGTQVRFKTLTGRNIVESTLGQVPFATRAINADRSRYADAAGSAQDLQGKVPKDFLDVCPVDTHYGAGGCVENRTRAPSSYFDAAINCTAGKRLPTVSELLSLTQSYGGAGPELTSDLQDSSHAFTVDTKTRAVSTIDTSNPLAFRCVAQPLNNTPSFNP